MRSHIGKSFGGFFKAAFFDSPLYTVAELTGKCNLRCKMCSVWKTFDFKDADAKKYIETINFLEKKGVRIAMLTGGEPLLRKDIGEIMRGINTINILTTNGFLLAEKINEISENCDFVFVSLDSPNPEEHDEIRGVKGAFERAVAGIKKTTEIGIPAHIVMTVMDSNIEQIEKMCELAKDLDCLISTNYLISLNREYNGKAVYFNNSSIAAPLERYVESVKKMQKKYRNFITTDFELKLLREGGNKTKSPLCRAGRTVIGIKPDASIAFPCTHYPKKFLSTAEWEKTKEIGGKFPFCEGCQIKCYIQPSIVSRPSKWLSSLSIRDLQGVLGNARVF